MLIPCLFIIHYPCSNLSQKPGIHSSPLPHSSLPLPNLINHFSLYTLYHPGLGYLHLCLNYDMSQRHHSEINMSSFYIKPFNSLRISYKFFTSPVTGCLFVLVVSSSPSQAPSPPPRPLFLTSCHLQALCLSDCELL